MSELVQLVNQFDKFEQEQGKSSIADFCRYYLATEASRDKVLAGQHPPTDESFFIKLLGRLMSIVSVYHEAAMAETPLKTRESFYMLNWLKFAGEVKKTDFVAESLMLYATGMDTLNRMIKEGFIAERPHDTDKRAKLIKMTPAGEAALQQCYPYMRKCSQMLLKDMHPEAIKLCISLLGDIEVKRSAAFNSLKGKPFNEMYAEAMKG